MRNFFQVMLILAVLLIALGTTFLVLDVVSLGEFRDTIQKALLVLAVFTGAGVVVSFLIRSRQS